MRVLLALLVGAAATGLNPITRVAQLLEGLAKKVEMDGKAEQHLYDKYNCWCKKVIDSKTTTMESNNVRIEELAAYIDDLQNGRVELTSERTDLEAEIKSLEKAKAESEAQRKKEKEDFEAAKDEMDKAITALQSAVDTMTDATKDHQEGVLASVAKSLNKAMLVGQDFLSAKDMESLKKFEAEQMPEKDWKKLNRDATFKKKYKARSGEIQGVLADMLQTFEDNLDEAQATEDKAQSDFDALSGSHKDQLDAARQALTDKSGENGSRGLALAESKKEKKDLEDQNSRDDKFLSDTRKACETKAGEWSNRKTLRADEIASINEAIGILRSDDARDTFNGSFKSQGFSFLQISRATDLKNKALAAIREVAAKTKDVRLSALSTMVAMAKDDVDEANPFVAVIKSIDDMVTDLKAEEEDDRAKKDQCESDRMTNAQKAKMLGKKIDTNTETMDRLTANIADCEKRIAGINEEIAELADQKSDATHQREDENTEYTRAKGEDTEAKSLVNKAIGALQGFYERNSIALTQQPAAGEAPAPPPSTFEGDYEGSKGENQGIVAIMEMIANDIQKDMDKATQSEADSEKAYNDLCDDIAATTKSLEEARADLDAEVASDATSHVTEDETRNTNREEHASTIDFLKKIAPGCDFIAVNFDIRMANRQSEMDGLTKAKAILEGAAFSF